MSKNRLCPISLGLSLGIVWGVSLLIMGFVAQHFLYGKPFVAAMAQMYLGYEPTVMGSIIGGIIGFVDAFILGLIIGLLYNGFLRCHSCRDDKCEK